MHASWWRGTHDPRFVTATHQLLTMMPPQLAWVSPLYVATEPCLTYVSRSPYIHPSLRLSEHPPPSPPPLAPLFSANSTNNTLELTQSSGLIGPVFVGGAAGEHVEGRGHSRGRWRGGRQRSGRGGEKGNRGGSRGGEGDDGRHRRVQGQAGEECTREELSFVLVVLHLVWSVGQHRFLFCFVSLLGCMHFLFCTLWRQFSSHTNQATEGVPPVGVPLLLLLLP